MGDGLNCIGKGKIKIKRIPSYAIKHQKDGNRNLVY